MGSWGNGNVNRNLFFCTHPAAIFWASCNCGCIWTILWSAPLLALVMIFLGYCFGHSVQERHQQGEEGNRDGEGVEHKAHDAHLREPGLFCWEERGF